MNRRKNRHHRGDGFWESVVAILFAGTMFLIAPFASSVSTQPADPSPTPVSAIMLTRVETRPLPTPTPEPESFQRPWTDEEVVVLAKMVWGEARGVPSKMEQAACVWCVLNRCDVYSQGVIEVTTAPNQFMGYNPKNPVTDELYALCEDVLTRWYAEKDGQTDVGRVLPPDYLYFHGDGKHNHFRNEFRGGTTWDWSYPDPYAF